MSRTAELLVSVAELDQGIQSANLETHDITLHQMPLVQVQGLNQMRKKMVPALKTCLVPHLSLVTKKMRAKKMNKRTRRKAVGQASEVCLKRKLYLEVSEAEDGQCSAPSKQLVLVLMKKMRMNRRQMKRKRDRCKPGCNPAAVLSPVGETQTQSLRTVKVSIERDPCSL